MPGMSLRPFAPWHAAQSDAKRCAYAAAPVSATDAAAAGRDAGALPLRDVLGFADAGGGVLDCATAAQASSAAAASRDVDGRDARPKRAHLP